MIEINLFAVGKLKENYLREASAEYQKRLGGFCKISIIEVNEYKISDRPSDKEIAAGLGIEGKQILSLLSPRSYTFSMCIEGKELSSTELSKKLNDISLGGISTVNFIIGSSFGLCDEVKNRSDFKLSMSKMTFPHQLARVMLLEQLYRALGILNNSKYHK
ncbi:MAG: 23S rRNA (pseudouridine(1915)-N(3))-methyltransferase RlmH [Ruminococcus sp.]|nr:23S rRNA (pseudouridine(1915)-N(3))-methyltransferase RlmH [Ruminococcus sp.]